MKTTLQLLLLSSLILLLAACVGAPPPNSATAEAAVGTAQTVAGDAVGTAQSAAEDVVGTAQASGAVATAQQGVSDASATMVAWGATDAGMWCMANGSGAGPMVEGERADFSCADGPGESLVLLGPVTPGDKNWEIKQALLTVANSEYTLKSSTAVPVTHIEVAGNLRCAWASSGASAAVNGERVNYSCGDQSAPPFAVLVGDITMGDDGWMIRRVMVEPGTNQPLQMVSEEMVPITALGVTPAP